MTSSNYERFLQNDLRYPEKYYRAIEIFYLTSRRSRFCGTLSEFLENYKSQNDYGKIAQKNLNEISIVQN